MTPWLGGPLAGLGNPEAEMLATGGNLFAWCARSSWDPLFLAIDASGRERWHRKGLAGLAAGDGLVLATRGQALLALDAADGRLRWRARLPEGDWPSDTRVFGVAVLPKQIALVSKRGLTILDRADGRRLLHVERSWELERQHYQSGSRLASISSDGTWLLVGFETHVDVFRLPQAGPAGAVPPAAASGSAPRSPSPDIQSIDGIALAPEPLAELRRCALDRRLDPYYREYAAIWAELLDPAPALTSEDAGLLYTLRPAETQALLYARLADPASREKALALLALADDRVIIAVAAAPPAGLDAAASERLAALRAEAEVRLLQSSAR